MKNIAIFASGNGSNAENIIKYFLQHPEKGKVSLVICNRREAGVYARTSCLGIETLYVPAKEFNNSDYILSVLRENEIDLVVLAGFMLMIPEFMIKSLPNRIINIHPSLLPKFGGKGMYGRFVHEAVVAAGERKSGITIHYVNEKCDEGEIIFQATTEVLPSDTAEDVESKIHELEKRYFPSIIAQIL